MNALAAMPAEPQIPAKINAAMEFIRHIELVRSGAMAGNPFGGPSADAGRELDKHEAEVYDSALTVMLEYFNEPGFGPGLPNAPEDPGEEPEARQPVEVE